jgi:hypothetical protein
MAVILPSLIQGVIFIKKTSDPRGNFYQENRFSIRLSKLFLS